jgi:hypothetical protein
MATAVVVLFPTVAAGAPVVQSGTIDHQIWMAPEPGSAIVIVSIELSADATLPATVRLPIPKGMSVDWAGEVVGGDPSQDLARPFVVKDGTGGKYAEFELSEHRQAQIDVSGKVFSPTATKVAVEFDIAHSVEADEYTFSVRLPSGVKNVRIEPKPTGSPNKNELGEALYTLAGAKPVSGELTHVEVAYRTVPLGSTNTSTGNALLLGLGVAVIIVLGALAFVVQRQRQSHSVEENSTRGDE